MTNLRRWASALALCAALAASPAYADNYVAKDGNANPITFAAKLVGGLLHPLHVMEGLIGGTGNPQAVNVASDGTVAVNCTSGCASFAGFTPTAGATTPLSATTTSADVALPAGSSIVITNPPSGVEARYRLTVGAGTALTTDFPIEPGAAVNLAVATNTHISAITASGSTTLTIQGGTGQVTGYGGGGSGGGGGAGTLANASPSAVSEGSTTTPLSLDLNRNLRVVFSNSTIGLTGTLPAFAATPTFNLGTSSLIGTNADTTCTSGSHTQLGCAYVTATNSGTSIPAQGSQGVDIGGVTGLAASGATDTDIPLNNGCRAATAIPTAVTDGQKVAQMCSKDGKVVTDPYGPAELAVTGSASTTGGTATTLIAAQGAGIKIRVAAAQCWNTSATTVMATFNDTNTTGSGTALIVPAGAGTNVVFPVPLVVAANTALTFTPSAAQTTVGCNAQGVQAH